MPQEAHVNGILPHALDTNVKTREADQMICVNKYLSIQLLLFKTIFGIFSTQQKK